MREEDLALSGRGTETETERRGEDTLDRRLQLLGCKFWFVIFSLFVYDSTLI